MATVGLPQGANKIVIFINHGNYERHTPFDYELDKW
jgi:hypothetical protein